MKTEQFSPLITNRMLTMTTRALISIPALFALMLQSCSTTAPTTLVGEWANPEYKKSTIRHILVVGASDDEWQKGALETTLKEQFEKRGLEATSTVESMPKGVKLTRESFEKYFKDRTIDAVLVSQLLSVDTKEATTDVYFTQRTSIQLEATFYGYYANVFDRQYYPGMATNTEIIRVETRLYETREAKLIWRAVSKTVNPKSAMEVIQSLSKAIVDTLANEGVLGKK